MFCVVLHSSQSAKAVQSVFIFLHIDRVNGPTRQLVWSPAPVLTLLICEPDAVSRPVPGPLSPSQDAAAVEERVPPFPERDGGREG